jgi:serine/threonine protein kinase
MFETFIQNCDATLIDYDTITFGKFIDSGASGKVYKAKLKSLAQDIFIEDKSVTIKCFSLNNYHGEYGFIDDVKCELEIYQKLFLTRYCCELIGYSYSRLIRGSQLYIIMKDYGVDGDLDTFKNQEKYWSKLNERNKDQLEENEYYYKYQRYEWVYDMNHSTKINITKGLCLAIEELHSRDIVHCDMKPGNVLYNEENNQITLIDFGASHHIKENKIVIDEDMGTLGYACSELNSGICSKKSDIYSLAVAIVEIWTGDIWNEGISHKECRNEFLSSLRYLSKKEPELSKILRSCTVLNVNKRPSIQTLKKNLFETFSKS